MECKVELTDLGCPKCIAACLEGVAVQLTDVVRKLLHILCDALICIGQASQSRCSVVGAVAAVLLVQMVRQPALESYLDPLLHVLQAAVDCCCRNGHTSKNGQQTGKLRKILWSNCIN